MPRNPVFGGFWKISGNCISTENPHSEVAFLKPWDDLAKGTRLERVLSAECPDTYVSRRVYRRDVIDLWIFTVIT
jgi:hypothetical protein